MSSIQPLLKLFIFTLLTNNCAFLRTYILHSSIHISPYRKNLVIIKILRNAMTMDVDTATDQSPQYILPGESFPADSQPLKLGPGLRHITTPSGETLIQATQAGTLHHRKHQHTEFYVDYNSHRVLPCYTLLTIIVHPKSRRIRHRPNPNPNSRLLQNRH
jgi:Exosome complex exonuclease Rrp40 N-terminal domain